MTIPYDLSLVLLQNDHAIKYVQIKSVLLNTTVYISSFGHVCQKSRSNRELPICVVAIVFQCALN